MKSVKTIDCYDGLFIMDIECCESLLPTLNTAFFWLKKFRDVFIANIKYHAFFDGESNFKLIIVNLRLKKYM
ncbi:hypothetical protein BJP50_14285 [Paenibacillus odorifer]|nr:hypothetical protein BJP50_14285 [Paenibacillus odorifer]